MKLPRGILLFFLQISIGCAFPDVGLIRTTCQQRCESSLIYSGRNSGLFCDKDCSADQCQEGCDLFPEVLSSTCSNECTARIQQKINVTGQAAVQDEIKNCNQGCVFALDEYTAVIQDSLTPLPQPTLIRESKNFSSVVLQWKDTVSENVTLHIHKKVLESNSDWQLHKDFRYYSTPGTLHIKQLHPYVTYQFKVLAVVSPLQRHIFESPATVPITTLPHGVPSSAPEIIRLSAPSPTVVSMTWRPALYPNGPLLGYRINLDPVGHEQLKVTTLEVPANVTSWTFSQCQSSQLYRFTLSAWNAIGEGPSDSGNITTPNPVSASETPYLLLGSDNNLVKSNILDMTKVAKHIHEESKGVTIRGVGVHIRRQLIMLSTSEGKVVSISITGDNSVPDLYPSLLEPTAISVDWLTDRAYVASRNRLYSCPLDRDLCFVAIGNLDSTPTDVKVDPVNGYLFYALSGESKGLYRVDLHSIQPDTKVKSKHIVTVNDLAAFVVDFDNVQLYFPNNSMDSIMSCFLDGSDVKDFRPKVVTRAYHGITSMAYYDKVFFWTDGENTWGEEFDPGFSQYRHNNLLLFDPPYSGFHLYHPKAQPTPVPLTSPTDVQALFTPDRAEIRWRKPQRLQYQGKGAWSQWIYEVELKDTLQDGSYGRNIQTAETRKLNHTMDGLRPNTTYHVKVRARSEAGVGPWSAYFIGTTLQQEPVPVRVLMGIPGMIIEKDLSKLTQETVVSFYSEPVDLSWHEDLLLWTTNHGDLYVYNRFNRSKHVVKNAKNAYCVAYDWLGDKIYWSEPKLGVIRRSDPRGIQPEFIYQAEARDISVDSLAGRLYWATTNSIDSAYLNGENHVEIFAVPFFSGRHVISLALNFDLGKVMWYVKGYDSQELWMANLIDRNGQGALEVLQTVRPAGSFHSIAQSSGLAYYSHKLFWIDGGNSLVVGDMECNYTSAVAPYFNNVTTFAVAHPSMQHFPNDVEEGSVVVIPQNINGSMIRTEGPWSNFNLTWDTDTQVNHGTIFYKLFLQIGREQIHKTTSQPWYNVRGRSPYTQLVVSLQPYTYWGYADAATVSIRSPMSTPQEPLTPRVYVTQHKNASTAQNSLAADFRWSTPHVTNGILDHHVITYWQKGREENKESVQVPGTARHFILTPLATSQTYFFQVVACTQAGCGGQSRTVAAVTDAVNPVPMLLIATSTGVTISEFDSNLNSTTLLDRVSPSALAYLAQDNRTFWIERNDALFVSQNSNQKKELVEMRGSGCDLSLDWISRTLYVVEKAGEGGASSIMGYHMEQELYTPVITTDDKTIGAVVSDPYTSMLLWTEINQFGQGSLMSAPMGTASSRIILGHYDSDGSQRRKRSLFSPCSCSDLINVSPIITMDYTKQGQNEVIFVDMATNTIFAADINGCNCSVIFKPTPGRNHGLPPDRLAVDHLRVYWYNTTEGRLYSVHKDTGDSLQVQNLPGVQDFVAYGRHLQPLPDSDCLDPGAYSGGIATPEIGNTSVTLSLEPVKRPELCGQISAPQDKFTVYYKKVVDARAGFRDCSSSPDECMKKEVYSTQVELRELEPHTEYLVQVAVSNYYTEYLAEAMSTPVKFTTTPGVPEVARDIKVTPLTPEEMKVTWQPPRKLNGPASNVTYVVHFSTVTDQGPLMRQTENLVLNKTLDGSIYTVLKGLEPGHVYDVKVETCMMGRELCNTSTVVQNETFDTPGEIIFVNATHDSLMLRWRSPIDNSINRHNYEYAKIQPGQRHLEWEQREVFPIITKNYTTYTETFRNLDPHTRYAVRVKATYRTPPYRMYVWPNDPRKYVFSTLAWKPEQPAAPITRHLKSGAYEVVWEKPEDNGAALTTYVLQYSGVSEDQWTVAFNGSERRWLVDESVTQPGAQYVFRVAAHNAKGWSPFSVNSSVFLSPPAVESSLHNDIQVGIAVAMCAIVVLFIIIIVCVCLWRRKQQEKKKKQQFLSMVRGPDTELATLRELPHSTFQQSNTLYGLTIIPTDEEVASLPHVCREQLDLTQFLGSGAFGEVYEGTARDIGPDAAGHIKCAVKTLRKSASGPEKEEFLKEAILMKNFQHQHILGLLGVCLDNDPHFIIMELMEGGDLLTFLRSSRASSTQAAKLQLPDLMKICVHVAKGCKYLEDMHFVHRDLAARNCLVSTLDPNDMVVKIGDFGLARDIYKNDYYRKEGEGLLPVRWMSPESLVDGVFTTQSDIWAFGVLMWEVVTLGQQPYPARTNIEVLHFVRAGGKLERPEKSTDDTFNLMQKCWSFTAEERPCFAYLLQELENYQDKCAQMSPAEIALHSPTGADGARVCSMYAARYATSSSDGSTCSSDSSVVSATQVQVYTAPSPSSCRPNRRGNRGNGAVVALTVLVDFSVLGWSFILVVLC